MKDWQLNKGSSVLKQFDCRPQQQCLSLIGPLAGSLLAFPLPPPPVGLHAGEWTLLSCIHCGLGYLVVRVSVKMEKKKIVAPGRVWKCSKCSSWVVGAGGGSPSACEEAKKKVLLLVCTPRPGTDIPTLCLTLLLQRPQSYGHYCHVELQLSDAVVIH